MHEDDAFLVRRLRHSATRVSCSASEICETQLASDGLGLWFVCHSVERANSCLQATTAGREI
jgi:hypothetical protein